MGYGRIRASRTVIAASPFKYDLPWLRTVEVCGSMDLQDYEPEPWANNEVKTVKYDGEDPNAPPIKYQVRSFQPIVELPFWSENVGGEIRGEVSRSLFWKADSSVDLR